MAEDNKSNDGRKNDRKNGEMRVPARGWILLMAVIGIIPLLMMVKDKTQTKFRILSPQEFFQKVASTSITTATITYTPQSPLQEIKGKYAEQDGEGKNIKDATGKDVEHPF